MLSGRSRKAKIYNLRSARTLRLAAMPSHAPPVCCPEAGCSCLRTAGRRARTSLRVSANLAPLRGTTRSGSTGRLRDAPGLLVSWIACWFRIEESGNQRAPLSLRPCATLRRPAEPPLVRRGTAALRRRRLQLRMLSGRAGKRITVVDISRTEPGNQGPKAATAACLGLWPKAVLAPPWAIESGSQSWRLRPVWLKPKPVLLRLGAAVAYCCLLV